jgi:hypothetical protein
MSRSRHNRTPRSTAADAVLAAWDAERNIERQRLVSQIEAAFDGVELGNGTSLHQGRALDDYQPEEAVRQARDADTESRWQEIPDEKVETLWDALSFLDAEGFRFYIPRFMIYALHHRGTETDSLASDSAISAGDPRDASGRQSLLSGPQREALRAFAVFFQDDR